jgi:hypothetical protein
MRHKWDTEDDFSAVINGLRSSDDRSVGITGAATAEYALQLRIEAEWPPLSKTLRDKLFDGGPLGTFSAKITISTAMGIIKQETRDTLEVIRSVRNEFAHDMLPLDFSAQRIAEHCEKLGDPKFLSGSAVIVPPTDLKARNRLRFIDAIHRVLLDLLSQQGVS